MMRQLCCKKGDLSDGKGVFKRMQRNYDKHDVRDCPMCGAVFPCLANRVQECPCQHVRLTHEETEWIGCKVSGDCLCSSCLISLREEYQALEKPSVPVSGSS